MRFLRVFALLIAVCAGIVVAAFAGEDYVGDRVFVRNSSPCDIVLMEEHSGSTIPPGERALAKSAFIEHSPSMVLISKQQAWTGMHFRGNSVDTRTREGARSEASIPSEWWKSTLLGRELTFEVTGSGDLVLRAPSAATSTASQPRGFPLPGLPATIPMQKELACH
ncbi:MAG: hypothetical protein ACXWCY_31145 [Burkholderiales bacterium]